jgi:hypothetical protein
MTRINAKKVAQEIANHFKIDFDKFYTTQDPALYAYCFSKGVSIQITCECIMINEVSSVTVNVAAYSNQKELIEDVIDYMHGLNHIIAIERDRKINEILDLDEAANNNIAYEKI